MKGSSRRGVCAALHRRCCIRAGSMVVVVELYPFYFEYQSWTVTPPFVSPVI